MKLSVIVGKWDVDVFGRVLGRVGVEKGFGEGETKLFDRVRRGYRVEQRFGGYWGTKVSW